MCDCVRKVNKLLAEHNTVVEDCTVFSKAGKVESRLCVPTVRIDTKKRKGPMRVFASFCPMCGEKAALT